jgi:hypothetical protein
MRVLAGFVLGLVAGFAVASVPPAREYVLGRVRAALAYLRQALK